MKEIKTTTNLLEVKDLSVAFRMYDATFHQYDLEVISNLSITVGKGEILAIVGSSGSGKSLLAHAILGLLPSNAKWGGFICYKGQELTTKLQEQLRGTEIALVPQSVTYLDPLMKVGKQVRGLMKGDSAFLAQRSVFKRYGLKPDAEKMYPFQLSGGMARRMLVSTAIISDAELIIADEPTPGIGTDVAVEMLRTFREFADSGKGVILITHDVELAFDIADRIAVFYAGTTVEIASASEFRSGGDALRHPYSKALYRALPQNGFHPTSGFQPYANDLPTGCLFAPRCTMRTVECDDKIPMRELRGGTVRCIHAT